MVSRSRMKKSGSRKKPERLKRDNISIFKFFDGKRYGLLNTTFAEKTKDGWKSLEKGIGGYKIVPFDKDDNILVFSPSQRSFKNIKTGRKGWALYSVI